MIEFAIGLIFGLAGGVALHFLFDRWQANGGKWPWDKT